MGQIKYKPTRLSKTLLFFASIFTLMFLSGCTRGGGESSKISITIDESLNHPGQSKMNKVGSLSTPASYMPMHLAINVHYGSVTKFSEWDCDDNDSDSTTAMSCAFPKDHEFPGLPSGVNGYVQILLVYGDESGNMIFGYDEKRVVFASGDMNLNFGGNWDQYEGKGGRVSGRYGNYTGKVTGFVLPNRTNAKPMKLFRENIVAGWFSFMFFGADSSSTNSPPKVSYTITSSDVAAHIGQNLFTGATLDSVAAQLSPTKAGVRYSMPLAYSVDDHGGGPSDFKSRKKEPRDQIVAFFNSTGAVRTQSSLFSIGDPETVFVVPGVYRNISNGNLLNPIGSDGMWTNPDDGSLGGGSYNQTDWDSFQINFEPTAFSPTDISKVSGQSALDSTACASITALNPLSAKCIYLGPEYSDEHEFVPFEGAFVSYSDGSGNTNQIQTSGSDTIVWKTLPGAGGGAVKGFDVFLVNKDHENMFYGGDNDHVCTQLAYTAGLTNVFNDDIEGQLPITVNHSGHVPTSTGVSDYSHTPTISTIDQMGVVCPYFVSSIGKKRYFKHGTSNGFHNAMGPTNIATKVRLKFIGDYTNLNIDGCYPIKVEFLDDSNNPAHLDQTYIFDLTKNVTIANGDFFDESDWICQNSPITGPSAFSADQNTGQSRLFFFKPDVIGSTLDLQVNVQGGSLSGSNLTLVSVGSNEYSPGANTVGVFTNSNQYRYNCEAVYFIFEDGAGAPARPSSGTTVYFSDGGSGGFFYGDPNDCEVGENDMNNMFVDAGLYPYGHLMMYYRNDNAPSTIDIKAGSDPSPATLYGQTTINTVEHVVSVNDGHIHTDIYKRGDDMLRTGMCYKLYYSMYSGMSHRRGQLDTPQTVDFIGTDVLFSSNPDCTGASPSQSKTFAANSTVVDYIYFIPTSTTFNINVNAGPLAMSDFINVPANQTYFTINSAFAMSPSYCNTINYSLVDDIGNVLPDGGSWKQFMTEIDFTMVGQSSSPAGFSNTPTTCAGAAISYNQGAFSATDTEVIYFQTDGGANSTDIIIHAEGIQMWDGGPVGSFSGFAW